MRTTASQANSGSCGYGHPGGAFLFGRRKINRFPKHIGTFDPIVTQRIDRSTFRASQKTPFFRVPAPPPWQPFRLEVPSSQFNEQYSQTFETGTNLM